MIWTPSTHWDRQEAARRGISYRSYRRWITPWRMAIWVPFWVLVIAIVAVLLR